MHDAFREIQRKRVYSRRLHLGIIQVTDAHFPHIGWTKSAIVAVLASSLTRRKVHTFSVDIPYDSRLDTMHLAPDASISALS